MFGGALGFWEILIILIAGVIIFGKQLPDVGRSLGKALMEFKKGLGGLEDSFESTLHSVTSTPTFHRPENTAAAPPRVVNTAPKFQDEPIDSMS